VTTLVIGLLLFFAPHALPMLPPVRSAVVARVGEAPYKLGFSIASAIGLIMIVLGYAWAEPGPRLFEPLAGARAIAPFAVTLAFILFAAANMPSHIRAALRHPMLVGLLIWSAVHLLANGDRRGTVLFGSFLIYAAVDLASVIGRGKVATFVPRGRADVISIAGGCIAALLAMLFHRVLFGPGVVSFGV
jgi:uncharacterized membrane protein